MPDNEYQTKMNMSNFLFLSMDQTVFFLKNRKLAEKKIKISSKVGKKCLIPVLLNESENTYLDTTLVFLEFTSTFL